MALRGSRRPPVTVDGGGLARDKTRMADTAAQIDARIRAFVNELDALVRQAALQAVGTALGGGAPVKRGPGRPRKNAGSVSSPTSTSAAPRRTVGGKRSPAVLARTVDALLKHVQSHPGERIEQ